VYCSCQAGFSGSRCEVRNGDGASHKYACTAAEAERAACLNNGSCFAIYIEEWSTSCMYVVILSSITSVSLVFSALSNPVPWQNWMAAYLGYTLQMKTLFRGWPVMVHGMHMRRRRSAIYGIFQKKIWLIFYFIFHELSLVRLALDLVDWPLFFIAMTLLIGSSGP